MARLKTKRLMNPPAMPGEAYVPTSYEHIANIISHAIMIPPSVFACSQLYSKSVTRLQSFTALVYGAAILLLFCVSSTFHTISFIGRFKVLRDVFHIGDRAVIYLFIAASYTPWLMLRDFHDNWGKVTLVLVWVCALLGILYQYIFHEKYKWLETTFYLLIGFVPAVAVLTVRVHHDFPGLSELALGGCVYASGVVFFKSDGRIPFAHAIWHCFVLFGSATHFFAVLRHLFETPPALK